MSFWRSQLPSNSTWLAPLPRRAVKRLVAFACPSQAVAQQVHDEELSLVRERTVQVHVHIPVSTRPLSVCRGGPAVDTDGELMTSNCEPEK